MEHIYRIDDVRLILSEYEFAIVIQMLDVESSMQSIQEEDRPIQQLNKD